MMMNRMSMNVAALSCQLLTLFLCAAPELTLGAGGLLERREFTTNAICREQNCINPVFPGLMDLEKLEASAWQCQHIQDVQQYMSFCRDVVEYNVAVPSPNTSASLEASIKSQEALAVTNYVYHLAGLNMEAWDHRPGNGEPATPCASAIRAMVCHTYFPKAEAGCQKGQASPYLRPCRNVCSQYVSACDVNCCDESTRCVFDLPSSIAKKGYADVDGPAATCTGTATLLEAARSGATARHSIGCSPLVFLLAAVAFFASFQTGHATYNQKTSPAASSWKSMGALSAVLLISISLQGCDLQGITTHSTAAWQDYPNYVDTFQVIPAGQSVTKAFVNSCDQGGLSVEKPCNGNGICKQWNKTSTLSKRSMLATPLSFCNCNRDWADPECRTRRKSQRTAFLLSMFTGYLGLDRFYVGEYFSGLAKLSTLGGFGTWWLWDIVRVGSSPIYSHEFRLAADLPHRTYVCVMVVFAVALGYLLDVGAAAILKRKKRAKMLLKTEDDFHRTRSAAATVDQKVEVGQPTWQQYREPIPVHPFDYGAYANPKKPQQQMQMQSRFPPPTFGGHSGRVDMDPFEASAVVDSPAPTRRNSKNSAVVSVGPRGLPPAPTSAKVDSSFFPPGPPTLTGPIPVPTPPQTASFISPPDRPTLTGFTPVPTPGRTPVPTPPLGSMVSVVAAPSSARAVVTTPFGNPGNDAVSLQPSAVSFGNPFLPVQQGLMSGGH